MTSIPESLKMDHPGEVIEASPAQVIWNRVEASYARSDLFERRRLLMDDWAERVTCPRSRPGPRPLRPPSPVDRQHGGQPFFSAKRLEKLGANPGSSADSAKGKLCSALCYTGEYGCRRPQKLKAYPEAAKRLDKMTDEGLTEDRDLLQQWRSVYIVNSHIKTNEVSKEKIPSLSILPQENK